MRMEKHGKDLDRPRTFALPKSNVVVRHHDQLERGMKEGHPWISSLQGCSTSDLATVIPPKPMVSGIFGQEWQTSTSSHVEIIKPLGFLYNLPCLNPRMSFTAPGGSPNVSAVANGSAGTG